MSYLIETNRLGLRPIEEHEYLDRYLDWLCDPRVTRFLENRFFPTDYARLREYVAEKSQSTTALLLGIHIRERGHEGWIGNIKLEPIDFIHRRGEIGLMIGDVESWGKGYGREAIAAVVSYGWDTLGLLRMTAGCYAQNEGSRRAFGACGFRVEGRYRKHIFCEGEFHDEILLGLLKEDGVPLAEPIEGEL